MINIKNITGETVDWNGFILEPDEVIDLTETSILNNTEDTNFFVELIELGDAELDVGNGVIYSVENDNQEAAQRIINKIVRVKTNGEVVINQLETLNFVGNTSVDVEPNGDVNIDIIPNELSVVTFQLPFVRNGTIKNAWFNTYETGIASNESPGIIPWDSKLIGLTFTNKKSSIDCNLMFYVVAEGDGNSPLSLAFEWQLLDVRNARKTNFPSDILFDAGDKIAIYSQDKGKDPNDVAVTMYFKTLSTASNSESIENYSNYFSVGGS